MYQGAVYLHQARTYLCTRLDIDAKVATVRRCNVKYYTGVQVTLGADTVEILRALLYRTAPHRTREIYPPLRAGGLQLTPRLAA